MVISASRRTDIPRFYMPWLMGRLQAGFAVTRNPMNPAQVRRVDLAPDKIDCMVFWSKQPAALADALPMLEGMGFPFYLQYTLNPYSRLWERNLAPLQERIDLFLRLSAAMGKERVLWRYDPIILTQEMTVDWHLDCFARLLGRLGAHTGRVTISFVDIYAKNRGLGLRESTPEEREALCRGFCALAREEGLSVFACCEPYDLAPFGVAGASCIDAGLIVRLGGKAPARRDSGQRKGCGCCPSVDIGAYDTCLNGCTYCYATREHAAGRNHARHNALGDSLLP
nr:DUF1848 domain-containing protein [bacterium]